MPLLLLHRWDFSIIKVYKTFQNVILQIKRLSNYFRKDIINRMVKFIHYMITVICVFILHYLKEGKI